MLASLLGSLAASPIAARVAAAPEPKCGWEGAGVTPSWVFSNEGGGAWTSSPGAVRFTFEDDPYCGGTNGNTQSGDATWTMTLAEATEITLSVAGKGEAYFEEMVLTSDGVEIARVQADSSSACGAGGICDMCTVNMAPTTLSLAAGEHTLEIHATTHDGIIQMGSYFEISFGVEGVPDCPPLPAPDGAEPAVMSAPDGAEPAAPEDAQIFDDPHVRTLSGNQFFLHGVGVFDYATIPGVIKTQVYMCPFAPCTKKMMDSGDCLTFINAVAIKMENVHPSQQHTVVLRNSSLRVDKVDRKGDVNITFGGTVITASGKVTLPSP